MNYLEGLLTPVTLIADDHAWRYPAEGSMPGGFGRLRIWTTEEGPLLAVVSEHGIGTSVMNAAEGIHQALQERFGEVPFVQFEHWPAGQIHNEDTLDQILIDDNGKATWNRIDPIDGGDPDRAEWMRAHGRRILAESGPQPLPSDTVNILRPLVSRG